MFGTWPCTTCEATPGRIETCAACQGRGVVDSVGFCERDWDEVYPGLFVGGHDRQWREGDEMGWFGAAPVYPRSEFDVVVSLYRRPGHEPAPHVEHHHHVMADSRLGEADARVVEQLAEIAAERVREGKRVLVRCQAGINRSSLVAALAMVKLGISPREAIDTIRERRSLACLFNPTFREHVLAQTQTPTSGRS